MKSLFFLLFFLYCGGMWAQPQYKSFTSSDGEVLYRYEDGYTIRKGEYDESERLTESAQKIERMDQDFKQALQIAEKAISLNKKNFKAWIVLSFAKSAKGDWDGSISACSEAIELWESLDLAWIARGLAKGGKGDWDGEILDCSEAIRLNPKQPRAWYNRGIAREMKGQYQLAYNDFKKAAEFGPIDQDIQMRILSLEKTFPSLRPKRPPTVHLVTVGIGVYQQDHAFNTLEFTVSGAFSMKNLFEKRSLTRRANLLHDSGARRHDILTALETLFDPTNVQEDDLVIFYFSGHGLLAGGKTGICPYDYQSPADLIADEDIESILQRSPARHKVCFIEACKSTTSADYLDPTSVAEFNRRRRNISPGIVFITSTEIGKKSWGGTEGYFTESILEALEDGKADQNDDRIITAKELFDYLQPAVKRKTHDDQVPQINAGYPQELEVMRLGNN